MMKTSSKKRSVRRKPAIKWPSTTYADVSTVHIALSDAQRLQQIVNEGREREVWQVLCAFSTPLPERIRPRVAETSGGYGFFVCLSNDWSEEDIVKGARLSKDFADLVAKLQAAGFGFLRLDAAAPKVKGLKVFKW